MAKISVLGGATSITLPIFIQASTSTTGLGLTGLAGTSTGLTAMYYRGTGTGVPITLTTSSLNAAYTSGLFVEVDSTRMPGFYRFDPPDAAFAVGPRSCAIMLQGAGNMAPLPMEVELTAWNNQDGVAGGIQNIGTAGTLGKINNVLGTATVILASGVHTGAIVPQVQTASLAMTVSTASVALTANTVGTASGVPAVVLAAGTHAGAVIPIVQTASLVLTANVVGTAALVTAFSTSNDGRMANLDAAVSSRGTGMASPGDAMALTGGERATLATVISTASQAEDYRGTGVGGSFRQLMYEIAGHLGNSKIVATTKSVIKADLATTAQTYVFDNSTAPTSVARNA